MMKMRLLRKIHNNESLMRLHRRLVIFMGDSHLREVAISIICDFKGDLVFADTEMNLISSSWISQKVVFLVLSNPPFQAKNSAELGKEMYTMINPIVSAFDMLQLSFVMGNIPFPVGAEPFSYLGTKHGHSIVKRIWPSSDIVSVFSWSENFPGYGAGRIPQLIDWCKTNGTNCVRLDDATRAQINPCAADFSDCGSYPDAHQCLPGIPTLLSRRVLKQLVLLSDERIDNKK
jgi:hypothetical protein